MAQHVEQHVSPAWTASEESLDAPFRSQWALVRIRFRRNPMAIVGAIIVLLLVFAALCAPLLAPHDPTQIFDDGLTLDTNYYYVISAVNSYGESSDSDVVAITPRLEKPGTPTGLQAKTNSDGTISLSWIRSQKRILNRKLLTIVPGYGRPGLRSQP